MQRTLFIFLILMSSLAHGQIEYNHEYEYECEASLFLSSFPMDTLLSDACNVVVYMRPPTFPGGRDSLNAHIRRLLPPPPSGEEGRLIVSLCIDEEGQVYNVSDLQNGNFHLWYRWEKAIDSAMKALPRWNPARESDGRHTSTCRISVSLRYSTERGVEVTGTLGDAYPPADPARMGYYLSDPVRLPITIDLMMHNLRGPVRNMEETRHHGATMKSNTLQYKGKYTSIYHYDPQGHMTECLFDIDKDSIVFRHSFYFPDNHGTDTLTIMLDEKGDTMYAIRRRNWYDCVGNLLVQTLDDGQKKDTTYFRYQFTADSSLREEYEGGKPRYREVFDHLGHLTATYNNYSDGRFHIKQSFTYGTDGQESTTCLDGCMGADCGLSRTKCNTHGDPTLIENFDTDGHPVETRTYSGYEYDDHGNWTARLETIQPSKGKADSTYITRRILYY